MLQLDPSLLQTAGSFQLLAQSLVEGFMQGLHRSPFKGSSQEFASYRPYLPGDPMKLVDWKLWARSDSLFVREFEEETNFRAHFFLDASKSMDFGEASQNKFLYARLLSTVLTLIMTQQKDAVGLAFLGGDDDSWLPPSTRRDSIDHLLHTLEGATATGEKNDLGNFVAHLEETRRRSLAIIITDGFCPPEELRDFLTQLRIRNLEPLFFHLLHPEELNPDLDGDLILVDSETQEELPVDGTSLQNAYDKKLSAFLSEVETICQETEVDYCRITTDQPLDQALQLYLQKRQSL